VTCGLRLLLVIAALLAAGCQYHSKVWMGGPDDSTSTPTHDLKLATVVVKGVLETIGMVPNRELDYLTSFDVDSDRVPSVSLGWFKTPTYRPFRLLPWVEVRPSDPAPMTVQLGIEKRTQTFFVSVIQKDEFRSRSKFTETLEFAVVSALSNEFPSRNIRFEIVCDP